MLGKRCLCACVAIGVAVWGCTDSKLGGEEECAGKKDGTTCGNGEGVCQGEKCQLKLSNECAGKEDGAACKHSAGEGICQNSQCKPVVVCIEGTCQPKTTEPSCESPNVRCGTECCEHTTQVCENNTCQPTTQPECTGLTNGAACGTGICYNNNCRATEGIPCETGLGTQCAIGICYNKKCEAAGDIPCTEGGTQCVSGVCYSNNCRAAESIPCETGLGTYCANTDEICQNGTCLSECVDAGDGDLCDNGTGICHDNTCKAPADVPCGVGEGTYCADLNEICRDDGACGPGDPGALYLNAVGLPNTPISPIDASIVFSVRVSGFVSNADANSVTLEMAPVDGLEFSLEPRIEQLTRIFTVTVTYNDTAPFPTGSASVHFDLVGIPTGYTIDDTPGNVIVNIRDGRARTPERVIWVNQRNIQDFNSYARGTPEGRSRHYQLTGDVNLSAPLPPRQSNWEIIGIDSARAFTGSFDGGDNTLSGLTIVADNLDYQSMFGYVAAGAMIENLGLTQLSITGRDSVGALVGKNSGTVRKCYAQGEVRGRSNLGGLVGLNSSTVDLSHADVNVTGSSENVGGLVGYNYRDSSEPAGTSLIRNSYATGAVKGGSNIGGLVGMAHSPDSSRSSTVQYCYATGKVSSIGTGNYIGGLAGRNYVMYTGIGWVHDCYATGDVGDVFAGSNYVDGRNDYVGGLVGSTGGSVFRSYATGEVNGKNYVGGLVGYGSGSVDYNMALNPRVRGTSNVGRVAGSGGANSFRYNYAFSDMKGGIGNWRYLTHNGIDGEGRSRIQLQTSAGFILSFLDTPWTYQPGSLPGLFGQTVNMPDHLQ